MKLSDILPLDTQYVLYGKVAEMFSSINNYKTIFSADSSNYQVVLTRLKELLSSDETIIHPAQYIFILFTRWQSNYSSLSNLDSIIRFGTDETQLGKTIANIIAYAYDNNLSDVLIKYKSLYIWSQHIKGKYLFSDEYTLASERAYKDIENWCSQGIQKKELLKQLDIHFEDSKEITRRKKFIENALIEWEGDKFPSSFIAWVASLPSIDGDNQKKLLYHIIQKFNTNSNLKQNFSEEDYATAKELDSPKYLNWKPIKSMSIYKLDTKMPIRLVYHNEQILALINDGDYKYFQNTKHLYVNAINEEDIASVLAQVYQDKTIPFDYQDYISICFDSYEEQLQKNIKIKKYEDEIERLKALVGKPDAIISAILNGSELATPEQIAENEEAKSLVLRKLMNEGFDVSNVDSDFSVINGVTKNNKKYPLVVKSCKNQEHRIWINPNEWQQLFKPNSMLWLHFGGGVVAPIKAHELFTYQDKLTLSFDTVNLMMDDRIAKIMEVLHYFNKVHLDLVSLNPNKQRANDMEQYLFNDNNNISNSNLESSEI